MTEKLWISNHALTTGIKELSWDGKVSCGYVRTDSMWSSLKLGRDAHTTEDEAKAQAEKKRVRKISALHKQIKKLEAMTF